MDANSVEQMFADYEALLPKIANIRDYRTRRDLLNMARSCENLREDISRESVVCRRLQRPTVKYLEYLDQFRCNLNTLSEYTTLALLMAH